MRDFTIGMYSQLMGAIAGKKAYTVREFLLTKPASGIILRHDVDVSAEKALRMARLEHDLGVRSSYYFRYPKTFNPGIIKEIQGMGHEIGYHYETLDKAGGDIEKALKLFSDELKVFRKYSDIVTISMHGSPLSRYDNRDLWLKSDISEFGIIGEAYLSFDFKAIDYLNDTGRNWTDRYSVKDLGEEPTLPVESTPELISLLKSGLKKPLYINTHPKRWSGNGIEWFSELALQNTKNIGKYFLSKNVRRQRAKS